jgi:uncharacterized protein (DUF4213/DUF364 family)
VKSDVLLETLERLGFLYPREQLNPGRLLKVALKPGWNVVIGTNGQSGMAMSFTGSTDAFGEARIDLERLKTFVGKDLFEVADTYLASSSWQERAVGVASLSALSQPLLLPAQLKKRGFEVPEKSEHFGEMLQPEDIVAVVGYGGGIPQLIGKCRELHVTDMRPRTAFQSILVGQEIEYTPKEVFVHPEKDNKEVLGKASVVIITGSSLVNGTFADLMSYRKNPRLTIAYGASVGMIPDVLMEQGVDAIHAHRVSDPAAFESGVLREMNMEAVIQRSQQSQTIKRGKE